MPILHLPSLLTIDLCHKVCHGSLWPPQSVQSLPVALEPCVAMVNSSATYYLP